VPVGLELNLPISDVGVAEMTRSGAFSIGVSSTTVPTRQCAAIQVVVRVGLGHFDDDDHAPISQDPVLLARGAKEG
jgi:hypothetical protein